MNILDYVKPELLILIPVLYLLGMAVKKTSLISDRMIPVVTGVVGILLSVIYVLATSDLSNGQNIAMAIFTALTQGILCAGMSTYCNQIFKQFSKDEQEKK